MLPNIIAKPPLILPGRPLKRRHNIVLVALPAPVCPATTYRLFPKRSRVTLRPLLLLEPAALALRALRIFRFASLAPGFAHTGLGRYTSGVLAGHERRVATGRRRSVGGQLGEVVWVWSLGLHWVCARGGHGRGF
jgi:hypothetical protein